VTSEPTEVEHTDAVATDAKPTDARPTDQHRPETPDGVEDADRRLGRAIRAAA